MRWIVLLLQRISGRNTQQLFMELLRFWTITKHYNFVIPFINIKAGVLKIQDEINHYYYYNHYYYAVLFCILGFVIHIFPNHIFIVFSCITQLYKFNANLPASRFVYLICDHNLDTRVKLSITIEKYKVQSTNGQ